MVSRRMFLGLLGGAAALRPGWGAPAAGGLTLAPPTAGQPILDGSRRKGVFMDTGTGRPESGMFGYVRKFADGSPRFHEGIDIAPAQPWRRDEDPTDVVRAAAAGRVAYVNRHAANPSLYGNYAVLTHEAPGFGTVYTLYAHLRRFQAGLRAGQAVEAGAPLGIMGHTPDFPLARAHLHFEIGVVMNVHYPLIDPQHGIWNGANLYGIDPCDAFREQREKGFFDIGAYVRARPVAYACAVDAAGREMDFFRRHPSLWHGAWDAGAPSWVAFSREGIPVFGRPLAEGEGRPEAAADRAILRTGRDWSAPKRRDLLLDNLTASPAHPPRHPVKLGEVG